MRFKAIPKEAANIVKAHPLLIGSGALLLVFAYYKFSSGAIDSGSDTTYNSSIVSSQIPLFGASMDSGFYSPVASSSDGMSMSTLVAIEEKKAANEHEAAMAQLQLNSDIALNNYNLGMAGIAASNFMASANLASSMLSSQSTSLIGAFYGPDGQQWGFGLAQTKTAGSKLGSRNNAIYTSNNQGTSALTAFMDKMGNNQNVVSLAGPSAATIAIQGSSTPAVQSNPKRSIEPETANDNGSAIIEASSAFDFPTITVPTPNFG